MSVSVLIPRVLCTRPGRWEVLWDSSEGVLVGEIPREEGGVAIPHTEEGLQKSS